MLYIILFRSWRWQKFHKRKTHSLCMQSCKHDLNKSQWLHYWARLRKPPTCTSYVLCAFMKTVMHFLLVGTFSVYCYSHETSMYSVPVNSLSPISNQRNGQNVPYCSWCRHPRCHKVNRPVQKKIRKLQWWEQWPGQNHIAFIDVEEYVHDFADELTLKRSE